MIEQLALWRTRHVERIRSIPWQTRISELRLRLLALLLILFTSLVYGVADTVQGIDRGLLWPVVWIGLLLGWLLAHSQLAAWLAATVSLITGILLTILRVGRLGGPEDIPLIRPYLDQEKLRQAAAAAVVPLAVKLADAGQQDEAIVLLRKAVESTSDRGVIRNAAGKLRDLGIELDLAREGGFLTSWWVLGPFPGKEEMDKSDVIPTDAAIDVSQAAQVEGKDFDWKYAPIDDPLGMMDMDVAVARRGNVGAYAYAEVQSPAAQDVTFKFGSDDSVFCWLNGQQVHAWVGSRGWGADQDSVNTSLTTGTNTILVKVVNGGGPWAFSLRVTDRDGKPLQLEHRKP